MAERRGAGRDFGEDVDRVVAGRREDVEATDQDYRRNLDFAERVHGARSAPRPEFQAALKARLLARVTDTQAEKETAGRASLSEWLTDLFRQRAWQVAGAVAVVVLALAVAWRVGVFSQQHQVVTSPYPTVAVEGKATLDNESYAPGETVTIEFSFTNETAKTLSFVFPPAFRIETPSTELVRSFTAGKASATLAPGASSTYSATWDGKDASGAQVPSGDYLIVMPNVNLGEAGFLSLENAPTIVVGR